MKTATPGFEETMVKGSLDAGSHASANRVRSNTWSVGCQPMTTAIEAPEDDGVTLTALHCSSAEADSSGASPLPGNKDPATNFRKNWTRRNAWGNLSYAELITKAIESSPEKRLTLSQIYDWIVHNVDYFANKGDNSSSAGWKNSIRHNLSLHSRFVRLVNDGAGKSSWWSINPDAQPLKPSRRRAATLDSKTLRKRIGEAGANRKLDFAGRSLEEVDSTTSGPGFSSSSSMLSAGTSSQDEVMAMDIGISGSPSRYPMERGFPKSGSLSGTVPGDIRMVGETGGGTPAYGVRDGFRMDLFSGKGPGPGPELCYSSPENLSVPGKGQLKAGSRGKQRRSFVPGPPEVDRSIGLGFCAGSGIFYDGGFDPPHSVPDNGGFYPKRYFDDSTGCYVNGIDYGSNCHSNSYYPNDAYTSGFYGNGGCFSNRTFPDGRYAGGSDPVGSIQGTGRGPREVSGGGGQANGQGLRVGGGFPEVKNTDQNGSRSNDGTTADENRELNAFPVNGYCNPYIDMDGIKETGGYDAVAQGPYRHDNDCFRDDGVQRIPSLSRFQEEEQKAESTLTDSSFLRALTTVSGYQAEDFSPSPDALTPMTAPSDLSSHDPYYRSTAGNKYPGYLSDPMMHAKPFSQLLANRATYPTCRNASTLDGFYIPTTF